MNIQKKKKIEKITQYIIYLLILLFLYLLLNRKIKKQSQKLQKTMNIYLLALAFLLGSVVGQGYEQSLIRYELLDEIQIRTDQTNPNVRTLLISEANTVLLISESSIAAYDMKTLNYLSQISIHSDSKIKEVNYLNVETQQSLYIVIQTESQEFKYFKFFTASQIIIQQKHSIIYPLLYPIIYDLNLNNTSNTADQESEDQKKYIYILESHPQVEQDIVQRNSLSIMQYSKNSQRINSFCQITYQFDKEDLSVKCKEVSYLNSEQNKFAIDLNEQYFFQKIDSQNHIFFFNKSEIITLHNSERMSHYSLIDDFKFENEPILNDHEAFKNFTFWKMGQIASQQFVFIYSDNQFFYIVIYNIMAKKITKIDKLDSFMNQYQYNIKDHFNVDILFYNKKILFQSQYDFIEVIINDNSFAQTTQYQTVNKSFDGFSNNVRFLELSYTHEGQVAQFAISRSLFSNSTYNIYIQNCMSSQNNQNDSEKGSYFANEFSCRKLSCSSHLMFQSRYSINQQVCLLLDIQKEKKQSNQWYKPPIFILLSIVLGIIGMKQVIKYIKKIIDKVRQYRTGNSIENKNLLKQDISEREKDGENYKMRGDIELTSQNNEVVIQSPNIQSNVNDKVQKLLNEQISDLNSQSSGSSVGLNKQNSNNNEGITPTQQDDLLTNKLIKQQDDLKDSYYNKSQLYSQQVQKEEKIKQLKLLQQQQLQLMIEKKNKTQIIQQSKSVQHIPIDQPFNPQIFHNYGGYQGNNIIPPYNQINNQNNQFQNQNANNLYYPYNRAINGGVAGGQQFLLNQNILNNPNLNNQNLNNQNQNLDNPNLNQYNQNIQQEALTAQPIEPIINGQFDVGQSVYIPQQKQNQQVNNNQIIPANNIANNNNNMIQNNFYQANLIQNEKQNNNQQFNNQNNQGMKNTHLNITQQLKFFQWALDQQFGFNQLNQVPLPHIIGDSLFQKSQSNLSNSNQIQQNQSIPGQQQLQQSLSSFQQFLSMELGDSSSYADNKPFILSHSQIEKLTQTLHQQYEVYKNSGINNLQKKEESELFQMFIKNELKSDLVFNQANEQFQQVQDDLKSTAVTSAVQPSSLMSNSQNQGNQNQQLLVYEEQKQQREENLNKKYNNINIGFQKQRSVEFLEDTQGLNTIAKINSQNHPDNPNKTSKNASHNHTLSKEDARLCQICYQHEKDSAYKCGHRYCYSCALEVKKKFGKCSFCNFEIEDVIKLYD
ncbi:zinc finger, C3HC4 type (RING finger) protein (macronuclear) [Tetrahymena thermophila SB210]|uniref:Zinc finger, C3HC4 type (RING finger) protein n=1 Tax=Tetrahymena thermophila (strain SB210) TaxID=312017 RepID=I7M651_TETTS|nr:zinc finger, C3HC4 type (RING finger) protein [Tetrahymena thermophila SB210]EAR84289.2 zinc finger, C3HC4 type (RING finger) protein [Tetrahymena thermophila SB210]|eukprot:XP_001031952.2 zinc finger, C3HC4 type (RING finger) protein [Tetrahymena thermophila SB210]